MLGVLLVLGSVLVGAKALAGADSAQQVWSATHDLAPGTVLAADDLTLTRVRLFGSSGHYLAGPAPVGYVVLRGVGRHELLPHDALTAPGPRAERREVTVPVGFGHLPTDLRAGDVVDLYATPDDRSAPRAGQGPRVPRLVLGGAVVSSVTRAGGLTSSGQTIPVVLTVAPAQVAAVVQALTEGSVDLVRVPPSQLVPLAAATPGA